MKTNSVSRRDQEKALRSEFVLDAAETVFVARGFAGAGVEEIAARDLSGLATMDTVAMWLSDLADCVLEAALAVARSEVGPSADLCRFAVIGIMCSRTPAWMVK